MNANGVMDEIERIVVEVAESIMKGNGFSFRVPTRSSGNQKYVEELDRIVLGDKVRPMTKAKFHRNFRGIVWRSVLSGHGKKFYFGECNSSSIFSYCFLPSDMRVRGSLPAGGRSTVASLLR